MVSLTTPNARLTWKTTNHESTQQIVFINCNLLITRKHDYKQESELETKQHSHLFSPTTAKHTHIYSNIQPIARTNKKSSTNQRTATKSPQPPYKESSTNQHTQTKSPQRANKKSSANKQQDQQKALSQSQSPAFLLAGKLRHRRLVFKEGLCLGVL